MHERKHISKHPLPPTPTTLCPQDRTPAPVRAPRRRQTPPRTLPPPPLPVNVTTGANTVSTVVNKKRSSGITATICKINSLLGFTLRAYQYYGTQVSFTLFNNIP